MCQECPVSLEKLLFFFIHVKIIQVLVFDNWHPLNLNVFRYSMIKHSIMTSEMNNSGIINPPERVRGMTKLDKSAFQSIVKVPTLLVPVETLGKMRKKFKSLCLKMPNLNQIVELDKTDPRKKSHRLILLNPATGKTFQEVNQASENVLSDNGLTESDFSEFEVNLEYENWSCSDVLHAVTQENVTGFSQIGHICHFNLKDYALPYKNLIGNSSNAPINVFPQRGGGCRGNSTTN